ncbi:hypothetical protein FOJ82_01705 [Tessaracoccus rhinocerotis]|uniref:Uncharacterized protein n=1 Tax=Tessaracoccus rhinocerotis TaxID=1689449 RepID=A0A553K4K6_9ACTN|nr:hypothetical protein [Tessaracoccus rhinocerotis]TRY19636.1 hypothetical protein FOJ82_01705 [Tessaracoccus rhinocerotis]
MPSFRVTTEVRDVRPEHAPEDVMEVGRRAVRALAHLDDSFVDVAHGVPYVALRFTVPASSRDDEHRAALAVAKSVWDSIEGLAVLGGGRLHRRVGGRWIPVGASAT